MFRSSPSPIVPLKPSSRTDALSILLAGGAGVLVLAGFIVIGGAAPGPAALACILLALLTGGLALGALQVRAPPPDEMDTGAAADEPLPYEDMLRALPEPVLLVGGGSAAGLRLTFVNRAARELFPGAEVGGLLNAAIRSPAALEVIDAAVHGATAGQTDVETRGAQDRVWRLAAEPLRQAGPARAVVMLRDETDVRRVARMRADFLANASHELRTPLASLTGFIETLQGPAKDDAGARERFLAIMAEQAGRMGRLINDLLSLSRIEMNEHIAPEGETDLGSVVRDVLDAMAPSDASARARILTDLPPHGSAVVRGDRDQLVQVAQNLIDNGLKYAGPIGEVRVEVATGLTAEAAAGLRNSAAARLSLLSPDHASGERYAVLRVTDSGPGIARENLPRLSERFYRVEGQKSGKKLGTGLGLAIVKHIINRHKGGLSVESAVGQGATFTAYLPAAASTPE